MEDRSRQFERSRVLPKIPTYGPASQLSPEVLLSRIGELGASKTLKESEAATGRGGMAKSASPRMREHDPTRQLVLPTLPSIQRIGAATQDSTFRAAGSLSLSARGSKKRWRLQSDVATTSTQLGLALYKGDSHHSFGVIYEEEEPRADYAVPVSLDETKPIVDSNPSKQSSKPTAPRKPRSSCARKAGDERDQCLRKSFRLEDSEIRTAINNLDRFQVRSFGGGPDDPVDKAVNRNVRDLIDKFDGSRFAALPQRPVEDFSPLDDDEDDAPIGETMSEFASGAEIAQCVDTINFFRWLCGLEPVHTNVVRLKLCDMVSQAVLPRHTGLNTRAIGGTVKLADVAASFEKVLNVNTYCMSVLHGSGSLIGAVEGSLAATHMLAAPPNCVACSSAESTAERIFNDVEARRGTEFEDLHLRSRGDRKLPYQQMLSYEELPKALAPLKVLWKLQSLHSQSKVSTGSYGKQRRRLTKSIDEENKQESFLPVEAPRKHRGVRDTAASFGLSAVWADRYGALKFRRSLLQPDLREFGAARRQDTCVLWTGTCTSLDHVVELDSDDCENDGEDGKPTRAAGRPSRINGMETTRTEAVCFPPAGIVPLFLLEGGRAPWTIMPDSARFQPTANTSVQAWRVRITRPPDKEWSAERVSELTIRGFAVDCSAHGEPFCVVFWPAIELIAEGEQFEICLSGLRGLKSELTFFYELRSFFKDVLDRNLCDESARFRELYGANELWSTKAHEMEAESVKECPKTVSVRKQNMSLSSQSFKAQQKSVRPHATIRTVSHPTTTIISNSVDLVITLFSIETPCIRAELFIMRAGGEEEKVPRATQVMRLAKGYFAIRLKLPMPRCRFQLRLQASSFEEPGVLRLHPLLYTIATGEQCPMILPTLQDPLLPKWGLAKLTPAAQIYGIRVLAPTTYRIHIGKCYFLVQVDLELAMKIAAADVEERDMNLSGTMRRNGQLGYAGVDGQAIDQSNQPRKESSLFSTRLKQESAMASRGMDNSSASMAASLPNAGGEFGINQAAPPGDSDPQTVERHASKMSFAASDGIASKEQGSGMDGFYTRLRAMVESQCQDAGGELHFDVALHNGECVRRLRERPDLPGFYDGVFTIGETDANTSVMLSVRFPRLHASSFAPRVLGRWIVVRNEHLPINF